MENRAQLVRLLQDVATTIELAEALRYDNVAALAEDLGVDRSELATLLDSAKRDDGDEGSANIGADEELVDSNGDGDEKPATGVSQESEQEAESGSVNQSFTVTDGGDNFNQSVGVQGTANTGNAQNQVSIEQVDSSAENIEFEGGSSIEVSPEQETQTQQEVEQAESAAAEPEVPQQAAPAE